ncbi:MAG: hypothetical protein HS111_33975 [Kofleriaceae bacterium]|nr:hypothetical protein [Kofleriaceae bacterium]
MELDNKRVGGKCVGLHVSAVAGSMGMAGSYTYDAGVLGPSAVTFPSSGTYDLNRYIAVTGSPLADIDWLLDSTPVRNINRSATNTPASVVCWAARIKSVFTTLGAGNSGPSGIVANSLVWNALIVGMYNYDTWNVMSSHRVNMASSTVNNTIGNPGQELPHLVGPGSRSNAAASSGGIHFVNIASTSNGMASGFAVYGASDPAPLRGTSFASPAVLSTAIQAYPYEGVFSSLYYPTTKKAILMAATRDANGDGQVMTGTEWTATPDGKDGAGQVDLALVKSTLDSNRYTYVELTNASFVSCGAGCREYTLPSFTGLPGKNVKAALAWNACAATRTGSVTSPTDLDLVLIQPAWCLNGVRQSTSLNNNVEMIYDTCLAGSPYSGTYGAKVRIKNGGSLPLCGSETSEPVAFAWSSQ